MAQLENNIICNISNDRHTNSFSITMQCIGAALTDHFPNTYLAFTTSEMSNTIYDFLSMQSDHPDIHPDILIRNVYVNLNKHKKISFNNVLIMINMFLLLYYSNLMSLDNYVPNAPDALKITSIEEYYDIIDRMATEMNEVVSHAWGFSNFPAIIETKLFDYKKVQKYIESMNNEN